MTVRLGLIGWRGMVGSVLVERMLQEEDFQNYALRMYSTSQVGKLCPELPGLAEKSLLDAYSIEDLSKNQIIISAQGGEYTKRVYKELRESSWDGYWIDAASSLRMDQESCIVLDPVNADLIHSKLKSGVKTFVGSNCTVSLVLMALAPLFKSGVVEWMTSMTYQAASGAGARQMSELLKQSEHCVTGISEDSGSLAKEAHVHSQMTAEDLPTDALGAPLAFNLLPFIDQPVEGGQSKEEWKGQAEINKILDLNPSVLVDGVCVRVPLLRCHGQAFLLKLNKDIPLEEIESQLGSAHQWIDLVPNEKEASLARLSPAAVSGTLTVALGRLRKTNLGPEFLSGFTIGDQLLWGAAEPLRRMAELVRSHLSDS